MGELPTDSQLLMLIQTQIFSYQTLLTELCVSAVSFVRAVSFVKRGPQLPPAVQSQNGSSAMNPGK